MSVLDASIVVRLLLNRAGDEPLHARIAAERRHHVPTLIDAEVTSAIRGLLRAANPPARISPQRADQMLDDFEDLALTRHALTPYMRRVLELSDNATAYDAYYLALAETLGLPLLTDDRKLAGVPGTSVEVEVWRP